MATAISTSEIKRIFGEAAAWPTGDSVADAVRRARRRVAGARAAGEDVMAGASLEVRRHPLAAVGIAAAGGIAVGAFIGVAAGWCLRGRA